MTFPIPCPMCGSSSVTVYHFEAARHQAVCGKCHHHGPSGNSKEEATIRWNAKAARGNK